MKIRKPSDVVRRDKIKAMDRATVKKEIAASIKRLNRKMRALESSGYDRYSATYSRLRGYNDKTGTHYFSSSHMANASLRERKEYLFKLQTYETYYGLTEEEVKTSLKNTADKLSVGELTITDTDIMRINDYMEDWREFINHSNLANVMESHEARSIFTNRNDMTRSEFEQFMSELKKFDTRTYNKKDFDVFLKSYDYKAGKPISKTPEGIAYNPMTGRIYNDDLEYIRSSIRISRSGDSLIRWDSKTKKGADMGVKLSSFSKESFYDYVFNDQRRK